MHIGLGLSQNAAGIGLIVVSFQTADFHDRGAKCRFAAKVCNVGKRGRTGPAKSLQIWRYACCASQRGHRILMRIQTRSRSTLGRRQTEHVFCLTVIANAFNSF